MKDGDLSFFLVFGFLGFLFTMWIVKLIFEIPELIKQSRLQTQNLRLIRKILERTAIQQGVPEEELQQIFNDVTIFNKID